MALKLNDLIKKAKDKGLVTNLSGIDNRQLVVKPWQQESIFFQQDNNNSQTDNRIDNKSTINRQQTDNRIDNKSTTNRQQTDNKSTTNRQQIDNKSTTEPTTNRQQTDNKPTTNPSFSSLSGLQRKITIFVYDTCKIAGTKFTPNLSLEHIANSLNSAKGTVKTTIQRLEGKGYIKRNSFKSGRGGWSSYHLPDLLFQEILQYEIYNKPTTNRQQIDNKLATEPATEPATSSPIVSSKYIHTTTILPEDFRDIDYSPLQDIGFDESHIIQIYREYEKKPNLALSAEILQNSINALAHDLKYNNAASGFKASPAVVLTAMLKKGQPYSSKTPEKVLSPQEAAMQQYVLSQKQKHNRILEVQKQAFQIAKQNWLDALPEEELLSFYQGNTAAPTGVNSKMHQTTIRITAINNAKHYFDNVIWPKKVKEEGWENNLLDQITASANTDKANPKKEFSREENISWFIQLSDAEKLHYFKEAAKQFYQLEPFFKNQNLHVLDPDFAYNGLFSMFTEALGRGK